MNEYEQPSWAQKVRQSTRASGRYSALSKCEICGKGVADYCSLPRSGATGRGLVLCHKVRCGLEAERRWPESC